MREGVGEVPTIATRELVTTVTVPNNETIVLGGLITTRDRKVRSGIPILSQIPYLGALFGSNTTGKEREELLIFIQPKIINDGNSLYDAQVDADNRYKIDDQNRAFIDGPGVLPSKAATDEVIGSGKGKGGAVIVEEAPPAEETGGPRRVSIRPKNPGFIKSR